ncbi:hypothetical protein AJ79_09780 [Helicocarpus griseus UAMH5409]|uniref:Uncharacterized protein n=1 Tax=Helicocarpus griseus UAMH5409 TaxID=1447875 RepID=A0A2B7WHA6_9EURO|nr:hypothetical protein AJ79_09780 [Helicocarpus griseus UAMH5409]
MAITVGLSPGLLITHVVQLLCTGEFDHKWKQFVSWSVSADQRPGVIVKKENVEKKTPVQKFQCNYRKSEKDITECNNVIAEIVERLESCVLSLPRQQTASVGPCTAEVSETQGGPISRGPGSVDGETKQEEREGKQSDDDDDDNNNSAVPQSCSQSVRMKGRKWNPVCVKVPETSDGIDWITDANMDVEEIFEKEGRVAQW